MRERLTQLSKFFWDKTEQGELRRAEALSLEGKTVLFSSAAINVGSLLIAPDRMEIISLPIILQFLCIGTFRNIEFPNKRRILELREKFRSF